MFPQACVAEEVIGRSGGNDELVERHGLELGDYTPTGEVDRLHAAIVIFHSLYALLAHFAPEGKRDRGRFEAGRRHLIEQRREAVVVIAVNDNNFKPFTVDMLDEIQSGESSAYNNDTFHILHTL